MRDAGGNAAYMQKVVKSQGALMLYWVTTGHEGRFEHREDWGKVFDISLNAVWVDKEGRINFDGQKHAWSGDKARVENP